MGEPEEKVDDGDYELDLSSPATTEDVSSPSTPSFPALTIPPVVSRQAPKRSPGKSTSASTDELKTPELSFATMPHLLQMVDGQVETGMYVVKRMRSFLQKYSEMHTKFAQKLEELAKHEKQKLTGSKTGLDRMETCRVAVVQFFDQIDLIIHTYKELGDNLNMTCVDPLNKFHAVAQQQQKEHHQTLGRITGAYDDVKIEVHKNRENCRKLLQSLHQKKAAHLAETQGKDAKTPSKGGFAMLKTMVASVPGKGGSAKQLDAAREKTKKACEQYQAVLKKADAYQHHHYETELPAVLKDMQKFEEMRLNQVTTTLRKFSSLQESFSQTFQVISERLVIVGKTVEPEQDILNFIHTGTREYGDYTKPPAFIYDMAFSAEDLTPENFFDTSSKSPVSTIFSSSLPAIMKQQEKDNPELKLDVPRVLEVLVDAVCNKEKGGLQSEGIFRLSVRGEDLALLRKQLDAGNYDLKGADPYASAALLKAWLRDLTEPVIPFEVYDECIAVGTASATAATPMNREVSSGIPAATLAQLPSLKTIFGKLPELNKKVIYRLVYLSSQITAPENLEKK